MDVSENSSQIIYPFQQIEQVNQNCIKNVLSYSMSPFHTKMIIATSNGFAIANLKTKIYVKYLENNSPFYTNNDTQCGVKLGSLLDDKNQIALIPNFDSKKFASTCAYIYDYEIKIILAKFDFFLPIKQLSITPKYLIGSNNKRIILFNYQNGMLENNESYYLKMYKSQDQNESIKYFALFCHQENNKNITNNCECGKYEITHQKDFKMVFSTISNTQNNKSRLLKIYYQKIDKQVIFRNLPYSENFIFCISINGTFLAYSEDFGKKINVYNLEQNCLYSVLYAGRQASTILNLCFIFPKPQIVWLSAIRQKLHGNGTMHFFKIQKTSPIQPVQSTYKRYFNLYKKTLTDYKIIEEENKFIGPDLFLENGIVYIIDLLCQYCQVINLNRSGLHPKNKAENFFNLEEANNWN